MQQCDSEVDEAEISKWSCHRAVEAQISFFAEITLLAAQSLQQNVGI